MQHVQPNGLGELLVDRLHVRGLLLDLLVLELQLGLVLSQQILGLR